MKTTWLKDCTTEQAKQERELLLKKSKKGLKVLKDIVTEKLESTRKSRIQKEKFESAGWAYEQADLNGTERTLLSILDLLDDIC